MFATCSYLEIVFGTRFWAIFLHSRATANFLFKKSWKLQSMSTYTLNQLNPSIMFAYIRALKFHPRCCPIHEIGKCIAHFTKWADVLPITRNGQYACLFREIGNFTDWA